MEKRMNERQKNKELSKKQKEIRNVREEKRKKERRIKKKIKNEKNIAQMLWQKWKQNLLSLVRSFGWPVGRSVGWTVDAAKIS